MTGFLTLHHTVLTVFFREPSLGLNFLKDRSIITGLPLSRKLSRRPAAKNFRKRAALCLENEGGHFEHSLK